MSGMDDFAFTVKLPGDANYTTVASDFYISYVGITAGRTLTLPSAVTNPGRPFYVSKDNAAFAVTVTATAGNVNGGASDAATLAASATHGAVYISDGTNWNLVSKN